MAKAHPNIYAPLGQARVVEKAYTAVADNLQQGSLSEPERITVRLAASVENDCVPVYTTLARKAQMSSEVIETLQLDEMFEPAKWSPPRPKAM